MSGKAVFWILVPSSLRSAGSIFGTMSACLPGREKGEGMGRREMEAGKIEGGGLLPMQA